MWGASRGRLGRLIRLDLGPNWIAESRCNVKPGCGGREKLKLDPIVGLDHLRLHRFPSSKNRTKRNANIFPHCYRSSSVCRLPIALSVCSFTITERCSTQEGRRLAFLARSPFVLLVQDFSLEQCLATIHLFTL